MSASNRERQRKWREKKVNEGKKRLTVLIDSELHTFLLGEKERTGETLSVIVNRAIQQMVRWEEAVEEPMSTQPTSVSDNEKHLETNENSTKNPLNGGAGLSLPQHGEPGNENVSDNEFSSLETTESEMKENAGVEKKETEEESDRGIGQARSLIKRLLSLTN